MSLITGLFFFDGLAYGTTLCEKTYLRKPFLFNKNVSRNEALDRGQKIASALTLPFQIVYSEEIKRRFDTRKTSESNILIGFMRDSKDRIQPVFSNSSEFQSTRELKTQMGIVLFGTGWNPGREAREIPLTILGKKEGVHLTKLDKTNDWLMLPDEIKEIFNNGNILVTSSSKLDNRYSVLMAVTPGNQRDRSKGRTGILLKDGVPIIIKIKDKEFIVEIKGVGNAEGGFDADYEVLRGGAQIEESEREFNGLETKRKIGKGFNQGETVRAVSHIDFRMDDSREQGYLIRLSPGSVRATYNKNVAFKTLERAERVKKVAYSMGKQMAEFFSEGFIPCSHPENLIVVDIDRKFIFTDYSDIILINVFPTELEGHSYDLYEVIRSSLNTVTEISGYKEHGGFKTFKEGLAGGLEEAGKISRDEKSKLIGLSDFEEIRDFLWKRFFASDYYKAREIYGWTPTFFRYLQDSVDAKGFISKIVEEAREKYEDNRIYREINFQKKEECRKENQLLENTGFTAKGIIAVTNSDEARRSFQKGMETLNAMDIWGAEYYVIWDLWGDNFSDLRLVAEHLKKEIRFLETVLDSIDADLIDDVRKNLKIARDRLDVLRGLTPYEYYKKLLKNPQYSKDMAMLPYFSKYYNAQEKLDHFLSPNRINFAL